MSNKKNIKFTGIYRIYSYILGIGLILFGLFAVYFKTYKHPIYGYIDLGDHNIAIGITSFIFGWLFIAYVKYKS